MKASVEKKCEDAGRRNDAINDRRSSGGYWMSHKPGTSRWCFVCNKQKQNIGHRPSKLKFICIDCKEIMAKLAADQKSRREAERLAKPFDVREFIGLDDPDGEE